MQNKYCIAQSHILARNIRQEKLIQAYITTASKWLLKAWIPNGERHAGLISASLHFPWRLFISMPYRPLSVMGVGENFEIVNARWRMSSCV